jgi:hypothetical protein
LYLINQILVNNNDDPDDIDTQAGNTTRPIIVKMKRAIGDYFGLTPLAFNDPIWTGTFGGNGLNTGSEYRRRLGGFKDAAYTIVAKNVFTLTERIVQADGTTADQTRDYKSVTIGFPKGHSVTEFVDWLVSTTRLEEIAYIRSPRGYRTDIDADD